LCKDEADDKDEDRATGGYCVRMKIMIMKIEQLEVIV